jgi:hypothetical protein
MKKTFKVSTFLSRDELDFLYTLEQDIYFNHDIRVPRSKLISEILAALNKHSSVDKEALKKELIERIRTDVQHNPHEYADDTQ